MFVDQTYKKMLDMCIVCIEDHRLLGREEDCFWCQPCGDEEYRKMYEGKRDLYHLSESDKRLYEELIMKQKRTTAKHNCYCDECIKKLKQEDKEYENKKENYNLN